MVHSIWHSFRSVHIIHGNNRGKRDGLGW
jgi:hypothetical protein